MLLSAWLENVPTEATLLSDGEFDVLEQCTRIRSPHALTFLEREKFADALQHPDISCVICTPECQALIPEHIQGVAISKNPKRVFFEIHNLLAVQQEKVPTRIDSTANISPQAYVAPFNVVIGKDVEIQPFAVINEGTQIQDNVRICAGTIIGGQSFSAVNDESGAFLIKEAGVTIIEEGVEICSNCNIARGLLKNEKTILRKECKLDALVHVGHGAVIGEKTLLTAGVIISGNSIIGSHVWAGPNATISNRITVGDGARVSLGAVVTKDVPAGVTVSGNFAIPHQRFMKNLKESIREDD